MRAILPVYKRRRGFGCYFPTFKRIFDRLKWHFSEERLIKKLMDGEYIPSMLKVRPSRQGNLARLLSHENESIRAYAMLGFCRAAKRGADISSAIPAIVQLMYDESAFTRLKAVSAIGAAAEMNMDVNAAVVPLTCLLFDREVYSVKFLGSNENMLEEIKKTIFSMIEYGGPLIQLLFYESLSQQINSKFMNSGFSNRDAKALESIRAIIETIIESRNRALHD